MQTSIRVSRANRDVLAHIATTECAGGSLDDALGALIFEHQAALALARLAGNPEAMAGYRAEAAALSETDVPVREW